MGICTDCYGNEYGKMIDSTALMQGLRRLAEDDRFKSPPRPCPARRPGNDIKTILKARLGRIVRRWRR